MSLRMAVIQEKILRPDLKISSVPEFRWQKEASGIRLRLSRNDGWWSERLQVALFYRFFMESVNMFFNSLILAAGVFFISVPSIASAFYVGLNPQAHTGGLDTAGKGFILELGPHSLRLGFRNYMPNVDWAVQHGMGVMFGIANSNGCGDPRVPAVRQCYADRYASVVQDLGSKAQYFEVWNEWNGGLGLGVAWNEPPANDAAMYTDLLCRTYDAIKAVRRSAIVVGGALAGASIKFINGMLDAGAGNCMDMLSVHLYPYGQNQAVHVDPDVPVSEAVDLFIEVINSRGALLMQRTGRAIPILVTEAGFSDDGTQAQAQKQADFVTELYGRAKAVPHLEGIWWFQLKNVAGAHRGLVEEDNTKKPSFAAFKAAAKGP